MGCQSSSPAQILLIRSPRAIPNPRGLSKVFLKPKLKTWPTKITVLLNVLSTEISIPVYWALIAVGDGASYKAPGIVV